jgi:hypothetical protein
MKTVIFIFLLAGFAGSCKYNNEEDMYVLAGCDTSGVKYSVQILSTLQANCYTCHSGTAVNGANIKLDNFSTLKFYATSGLLMNALTRQNNSMPKGNPKLPECKIAEIQAWVNMGAPQN